MKMKANDADDEEDYGDDAKLTVSDQNGMRAHLLQFASPAGKHWFHFALVARTWLTCAAYSLIINHNLLIVIYGVSKHYGKSKVYALRSVWLVSPSFSSSLLPFVPCIEMKLHYFVHLFIHLGRRKNWSRHNGRANNKKRATSSLQRQAPSQWKENWTNCTPAKGETNSRWRNGI